MSTLVTSFLYTYTGCESKIKILKEGRINVPYLELFLVNMPFILIAGCIQAFKAIYSLSKG